MGCPKFPKIDTLYTRDEKFKVTDEIRRPEFLVPREWLVTEKIHGCNIRVSLEENVLEPEVPGERGIVQTEWVMRINGRNDNSQIPPNLLRHLQETFTLEGLKALWRCKASCFCLGEGVIAVDDGPNTSECGNKASQPLVIKPCPNLDPYPITLYGEGYGGSIQKGGHEYTSKTKGGAVSFRLFDVLVGETWLRRADVEDVAEKLGIKSVPLILGATYGGFGVKWDLESIMKYVREGAYSLVAAEEGSSEHLAEGVVAFTAEPLYNNRGQRLMFKLKATDFS
jgi:hypothetical protein